MATESVQGWDVEVLEALANKVGPQWEELFVHKWGTDWAEPARLEMEYYLGQGWEEQPAEVKSEALAVLVTQSADTESAYEEAPDSTGNADSAGEADSESPDDPEAYPSLDDSPWISTLLEVDTFEDWLVRIGVDATTVESLAKSAETN
jgi:hypothetical protein